MIPNIEKYAGLKSVPMRDALQVWMQMATLKNLSTKKGALIGGTALVIGHGNPRFSEDIDLTGVDDPMQLKSSIQKTVVDLEGMLGADVTVVPPKTDRRTWRIRCKISEALQAQLHVDSQVYLPLTHHPIVAEYPGITPFVVSSVALGEIMADKIVALAFRKNISGRDIFDLWYHWLRREEKVDATIKDMIADKLHMRSLKKDDLLVALKTKLNHGITRRVEEEWNRYLPVSMKDPALYKEIFTAVKNGMASVTL